MIDRIGSELIFCQGFNNPIRVERLIPFVAIEGKSVELIRAELRFDEGMVEPGGSNKEVLCFTGFDKIISGVPDSYPERGALNSGLIPELLPEWFKQGDIIRLPCVHYDFRQFYRQNPKAWKRRA
jgi:hypothetical protein